MTDVPLNLLTVHPLLEPLPPLAFEAPEMRAIIDGIELHGVLRPVVVNDRREIMTDDGRTIVRAAQKAGLDHVPALIRPDDDAPALILTALCGYRHLSKSALAYLAFPLMEAARNARLARRSANLKAGANPRTSFKTTFGESVEDLSDRLGFQRSLYFHARKVRAYFRESPAFCAEMEPQLLSGDISLHGIIGAWEGIKQKGLARFETARQLSLFGNAFAALRFHFRRTWDGLDTVSRAGIEPQVVETVAEMPREVRAIFVRAIKQADQAERGEVAV